MSVKQPICIIIIGWIWIVLGTFIGLSGASNIIKFHLADILFISPLLFLFPLVPIGVGIFIFMTGASFLKLRPWSRRALEVITWLYLFFLFGFIPLFAIWRSLMQWYSDESFFTFGNVALYLLSASVLGLPAIIMLKFLRGKTVKDAIHAAGAESAPADSL